MEMNRPIGGETASTSTTDQTKPPSDTKPAVHFALPSNSSGKTSSNPPSVHSTTSIPNATHILSNNSSQNATTLEQFVQAFNSNAEDGERIIEVSPNGRYAKLNVVLGKGAYKVVYKAIDREEGYEVAWNCFQTTRAEFNELSQEIEILKRVRHPNIINFHDCWYNNVEFVFVTELMTSGTLREYIRKLQNPNMKIVKRWCRQILKGLLYLHSHNPSIIHRDIKCDNIFINGAHGEVKIGDMGTAKMKLGKKYTVIGTPEFMAPEMYEEKGYSEKVDVYAFGMCLLEMVTGEYPYSECSNAAQVYKKVTQGIKPECMSRVKDPEVIDLINRCLCTETERWSVSQVLEHSFLTVEPEVVLLAFDENKIHLTLQVVFKGTDKVSVKFEFNTQTDTAEEVVNEMIEENVLPQKYQQLITHEFNRILRDLNKIPNDDPRKDDGKETWRSDIYKDELEKAKLQVKMATERALEAEKKAELSEVRARLAEEKSRSNVNDPVSVVSPAPELASSSVVSSTPNPSSSAFPEEIPATMIYKEYRDDQAIDDLVKDTAIANNRGLEKASEWLQRLQTQDIMTVGDLRDLHDEDWSSLGLTVFASRALRNALHGKANRNISPKTMSRSVVVTPPASGTVHSESGGDMHHGIGLAMTVSAPLPTANKSPPASLEGFNSHDALQNQNQQPQPPQQLFPNQFSLNSSGNSNYNSSSSSMHPHPHSNSTPQSHEERRTLPRTLTKDPSSA